jgi:hypothetical protein
MLRRPYKSDTSVSSAQGKAAARRPDIRAGELPGLTLGPQKYDAARAINGLAEQRFSLRSALARGRRS